MQSLMGTLNKMPAAVEAMSRSASRCSTAKKSAAPSPAPEPGNFAMGQMGEKPVARNVPLGTGLPAAVVIGGDNIRRHRPNSSRNALSSDDDAFIQDDDQPGPDLDTPWPPGGSGGDDDDDFYTPKTPLRSRQPRRSKSADIYKRRAQMHKHPSGLPTPDGSMTPTLPSLMKNRSRDLDTMSVASSMARSVSSTQVSSWKEDEHIQEWYKARKEKEKETAKMKIRRAHKDLNWVLERRTAQIANFRRDRKNEEKADKATVVKEKAHAATGHLKGIVNAAAKLKAVSAGAGGKASGMATLLKQATGGSNNAGENGGGDAAADTQGKDGGEDSLPSVDVPKTNPRPVATLKASMFDRKPKVHHEEESVWLGPVASCP